MSQARSADRKSSSREVIVADVSLKSKVAQALNASVGIRSWPVQLNYGRDQGETDYGSSDPHDPRVTQEQRERAKKCYCSADVEMYDARQVETPHDLFVSGFQLETCPTALSEADFFGRGGMSATNDRKYKKEQEDLVKRVTGASTVVAFHTNVRNSAPESKNDKPAFGVHCDYATKSAMKLFDEIASGANRSSGRFVILNTWRSVDEKNPIFQNPLACADARSVIGPDDFIPAIWYQGQEKNYNYKLDAARRHFHRWWFYPRMQRDEVLMFMQYDSDPLSLARYCFHSAFPDPTAPKNAPPRKSIETRLICFFPDHSPSTIPSFVLSENELVDSICAKLMQALGYPQHWGPGRQWMKDNLKPGGRGHVYLITELVRGGVTRKEHGLEKSTQEQRDRIIATLLSDDKWLNKAKRNFL